MLDVVRLPCPDVPFGVVLARPAAWRPHLRVAQVPPSLRSLRLAV